MENGLTREEALQALQTYNHEPFHLQHALTVEAIMGWFAKEEGFEAESDFWRMAGLLHDIDFEQWPEQHCVKCIELLQSAHATPETAAVPAAAAVEILPRYRALYEKNPDLIGWLRIDGTNINNVVMFAPDTPGKYLHMDFYGKWSYRGTLYVAENCDVRTADNILIYGHHMKDGSMFGSLISYKDAAFRAAHPIVQFDTLYASHSYEVVAAIETEIPAESSNAFRYYDCVGTDAQQFAQYCAFIEENRCYDTGITILPGDRLLTLSTCAYHTANGRFLVVARQID